MLRGTVTLFGNLVMMTFLTACGGSDGDSGDAEITGQLQLAAMTCTETDDLTTCTVTSNTTDDTDVITSERYWTLTKETVGSFDFEPALSSSNSSLAELMADMWKQQKITWAFTAHWMLKYLDADRLADDICRQMVGNETYLALKKYDDYWRARFVALMALAQSAGKCSSTTQCIAWSKKNMLAM